MKKLNIIYILISGILLLFSTSCKKILDLHPLDATYDQAYWKTQQDALSALAGNYALLRAALTDYPGYTGPRYYLYGDVHADEFSDNIDWVADQVATNTMNGSYFGGGNNNLNNWSLFYKVIAQSNLIITRVPGMNPAVFDNGAAGQNQLIGEAMFLRAFTYFYMVRLWGDVPLVLHLDPDPSNATSNVARTPQMQVLDSCISDCGKAAKLLAWGYDNPNDIAVRADKGSVFALQAHIYAWRAEVLGNNNRQDLQASADAADSVLVFGGYQLVDSAHYMDIYKGKSIEGIFELNMSYAQNEAYTNPGPADSYTASGIGFMTLRKPYNDQDNPPWWISTDFLNNIYTDPADARQNIFFDFLNTPKPIVRKYSNTTLKNPSDPHSIYYSGDMIIFRLAGIILLRAETLTLLGDNNDAIALLNTVRNRAGRSNYNPAVNSFDDSDLYTEIIHERMRELCYEGQTYFDLVRSKMLPDYNVNISQGDFSNGAWLLPIDASLFKDNTLLSQNKFWLGKF